MSFASQVTALAQAIGADIKALFSRALPAGGSAGQVLVKSGAADYSVNWTTPGGVTVPGTDGQVQYASGGALAAAAKVGINEDGTLLLAEVDAAVPPDNNSLTLYARTIGTPGGYGALLPSIKSVFGEPYSLQPALFSGRLFCWNPPGGATTVPGVFGGPALTAVGTVTSRAVAATNRHALSLRLGYVSAATAGSVCGHYTTTARYLVGNGAIPGAAGFLYACRFSAADAAFVSGARQFVGLSSSTSAPTNTAPSGLLNSIGMVLSGESIKLVCSGVSGDPASLDLSTVDFPDRDSANATGGAVYDLFIYSPQSVDRVVIIELRRVGTEYVARRTVSVADGAAYMPTATTLLAHRAWRANNSQALAVGLDIMQVNIWTDY